MREDPREIWFRLMDDVIARLEQALDRLEIGRLEPGQVPSVTYQLTLTTSWEEPITPNEPPANGA